MRAPSSFATLCTLLSLASTQNSPFELDNVIKEIFPSPNPVFLPDYDEILTQKPTESFGANERCGKGADAGTHTCVRYYNCDQKTNTIIQEGPVDESYSINMRSGQNPCDHYLDVCCKIPKGGIPSYIGKESKDPLMTTTNLSIFPTKENRENFCGIRNNNGIDFKLIGNDDGEAEYAEFPWMIEILKKHPDEALCGASLITPKVVITGAYYVYSVKPSDIRIRAGEWDTQTTRERLPHQERDVLDIIIHPQFNPRNARNNVALLIMSSPLKKADNVGTICMPPQGLINNAQDCFVTGWGRTKFGAEGAASVILKKIQLPMVSKAMCQRALRTTRLGALFNLHSSFVCAGGEMGVDACTGDGGGPLVCPDPDNPKRYQLTGIVSWGIGCGEDGVPGVYTDVARFREWVDREMEKRVLDTAPYRV